MIIIKVNMFYFPSSALNLTKKYTYDVYIILITISFFLSFLSFHRSSVSFSFSSLCAMLFSRPVSLRCRFIFLSFFTLYINHLTDFEEKLNRILLLNFIISLPDKKRLLCLGRITFLIFLNRDFLFSRHCSLAGCWSRMQKINKIKTKMQTVTTAPTYLNWF